MADTPREIEDNDRNRWILLAGGLYQRKDQPTGPTIRLHYLKSEFGIKRVIKR